jgi:transformation/transcription domain-associated protein
MLVFQGLLEATRVEDFKSEAVEYVHNLVRFIFSLEIRRERDKNDVAGGKQMLPLTSALINGIVENLARVEPMELDNAAQLLADIVNRLLDDYRGDEPEKQSEFNLALTLIGQLASNLCSLCYDTPWQWKTGGATGIEVLVSKVTLPSAWLEDQEAHIVRALFFMLKDVPQDPPGNVGQVSSLVVEILRRCNPPGSAVQDGSKSQAKVNYLVKTLAVELASQVRTAREAARAVLDIFAEACSLTLTDLLRPHRDLLLGPIFNKPLRALAFPMQIGNIDAITYCISLRPPLIDFGGETPAEDQREHTYETSLNRLLTEALGIADAEDSALTGKSNQPKNAALLTTLRVVCVRLLTAAMESTDFASPPHAAHRMKIISTCFKLLYARSPEVVDAAFQNLKQVLAVNGKLPKDLLQQGLRPVLMNLSDPRKISSASLAGLARLLGLLTNYFKVEIGQKLVEHFAFLSEPAKLHRAALSPQKEDSEIQIIAGLVNIFHLLPHPAAGIYLTELCGHIVRIETILRKDSPSPFSDPLAQYLDRYPVEACKLFFDNIGDARHACTFRNVLASPHAGQLRSHITANVVELFRPCFTEDAPELAPVNAASLILQLVKLDEKWIAEMPQIVEVLKERWVSEKRRQRLNMIGDGHSQQLAEDSAMLDIFIAFLRQSEYIDLLFHVVDVFTVRSATDHSALLRFFYGHVTTSKDVPFKQRVLGRFFDIFENAAVSQAHKTVALRFIINPIMAFGFRRGEEEEELVTAEFIADVHTKLWLPSQRDSWVESKYSEEPLKIELLSMSTLLLRYRSHLVGERRKDVIKFAWVNIKNEDITVKQTAHNLAALFLATFGAPRTGNNTEAARSNIVVIKLFVALLRAHQPEAKTLVREALDVLTPSLPRTFANEPDPLQWLKMTRTILINDGHSNMSQLTHVYQLLVRHPDLFFPKREFFVQHIVSSLPKLALVQTATSETRQLTVDLIELLLKWERKRLELAAEAAKEEESKMDTDEVSNEDTEGRSPKRARLDQRGSSAPGHAGGPPVSTYAIPQHLRDGVFTTLIRLIGHSQDPVGKSPLTSRAMKVLKDLVDPSMWGDLNVKLHFFQRMLLHMDINDQTVVIVCNTLEVLNAVLSFKSDDWVRANLPSLQRILEKCIQSSDERVLAALRPILDRVFSVIPPVVDGESGQDDIRGFTEWANNALNDGLRDMTNLPATMTLLRAWVKADPEKVDAFAHPLTRVLSKTTKEHLNMSAPVLPTDPDYRLLVSTIEVLCVRVSFLGENRRWLLSALVQLVEKSHNVDLCRMILEIMRKWVKEKEMFPTIKEKAVLLIKMMTFETRHDDSLVRDFLDLILDIYTESSFARSELTVRLEQAFLLGCRNRDAPVRYKFLDVFDKSISRHVFERMHYLLGVQNWESLGETNWLHQALDLLLGSVDADDSLYSGPSADKVPTQLRDFVNQLVEYRAGGFVDAARKLLYADANSTHAVWVSTFKAAWSCLSRKEQADMTRFIISLFTKEYHLKNIDRRPNVIQTLLAGLLACSPPLSLPPHLVRYLGKTFNAWHTAMGLLCETVDDYREEDTIREASLDALAEMYADLCEEDYYWGLWHRRYVFFFSYFFCSLDIGRLNMFSFRALYPETSTAISFEQAGAWQQAQMMYEAAQVKARQVSSNLLLPFVFLQRSDVKLL